jgi:cytochrome b561
VHALLLVRVRDHSSNGGAASASPSAGIGSLAMTKKIDRRGLPRPRRSSHSSRKR